MNEIKMSSELTEMYVLKSNYEELEKENEELKKELSTYGATGICETCIEKANVLCDKYREILKEIQEIAEYSIMHNTNLNSNYQLILQKIKEEV